MWTLNSIRAFGANKMESELWSAVHTDQIFAMFVTFSFFFLCNYFKCHQPKIFIWNTFPWNRKGEKKLENIFNKQREKSFAKVTFNYFFKLNIILENVLMIILVNFHSFYLKVKWKEEIWYTVYEVRTICINICIVCVCFVV